MKKKFFIIPLTAILAFSFVYFTSGSDGSRRPLREEVKADRFTGTENATDISRQVIGATMVFEGPRSFGDWWLGPEIPLPGMSGFYDYHFNGEQPHYLYRHSSTVMHAIYMLAEDSLNPTGPSRRTRYAFSSDDGETWDDLGEVPPAYRTGYPSVTAKSNGVALIGNHMLPIPPATGSLTTYNHYDAAVGTGVFTSVRSDPTINFIWPLVSLLTNGNILTVGMSYRGSAATDTPVVSIFNSTTNTFGPDIERLTGATSNNNASMATAAGTNGRAIHIVNAYRETGGNWGGGRIWMSQSSDNGQTWSPFSVVFNEQVIGNDSVTAFVNGATDVIWDNAGNYYFVFNSLGVTFVEHPRLWISKNGNTPILIAGGYGSPINPIPEVSDTGVAAAGDAFHNGTLEHPCLSISDDQQYIFVGFAAMHRDDTLGGFRKAHIYYSFASLSNIQNWAQPIRITNAGPNSFDERYVSIATRTPVANGQYTLYFTYQKDTRPGSYIRDASLPVTRAWRVFRKVYDATNPIGVSGNSNMVRSYRLNQNYPNPFNPNTKIEYTLAKDGFVSLKLYNVLGEEVKTLVNDPQQAGSHVVDFTASNLPSGIYFYSIEVKDLSGSARSFKDTKRMVLLK